MKIDRIPWYLVIGFVLGIGLGLIYSWVISPVSNADTSPSVLRTDFKDQYRAAIAAAYLSTGDLGRAQARLDLLNDSDPVLTLTVQAQRTLAGGGSAETVHALALLAVALQEENASGQGIISTFTPGLPQTDISTTAVTEPVQINPPVPLPTLTSIPLDFPSPQPARTLIPTLNVPYVLIAKDTICDPELPEGLLQVIVSDKTAEQVPGVKITITWNGGEEHFFTGFKPELGNGYADYVMPPDILYTLHLADGSVYAYDLSAPTCKTENEELYWGGLRLKFQQP